MRFNLKDYVVKDDSGQIDVEATESKFANDLASFLSFGDEYSERAEKAVHAVFNKHPGQKLSVPALVTFATYDASIEDHPSLVQAVKDYIAANQGEGGLFEVTRGPGGGIKRINTPVKAAPIPPPAPVTSASRRKSGSSSRSASAHR